MKNSQKPFFLLLAFILLVGSLLRFWEFWNLPFMFDELSAMGRTTYDSFSDLIQYGVIERDSHPAGIQVFMYYWTMFFGESEIVVKFPFLLAGIISIWISFRIGELWFGRTTGILTATFVSSLQLFVMYSQIARPYISGLFFTLMMVLYWSKYFFIKPKIKYLFWFVAFASLSAYNHYFSLLFAATVGFSGLLFVKRNTVWPYIFSGIAITVLYLPHLNIFLAQADKGTIGGWLGMPGPYFLFEFLYWLFHKSYNSIGLFIVLLAAGIAIGTGKQVTNSTRKRVILLLWLLPSPIFGYAYSYCVEPILQNSLLIFTTPYLMILLFSFIGEIGIKKLSAAVIVILAINIITLTIVRDYYRIFYRQPFEEVVKEAIKLDTENPGEVFIINDYIPYYSEYYFRKYHKKIPYYTVRNKDFTIDQFDSVLRSVDENIVISSGLDHNGFLFLKYHFPNWIGYNYGFTYEHYSFSKTKLKNYPILETSDIAVTDFNNDKGKWIYSSDNVEYDSALNRTIYKMKAENEWGPKIKFELDSLTDTGHLIFDIVMKVEPLDDHNDIIIVCELANGDDKLAWIGFNTKEYNLKIGEEQNVFFSLDIQDVLGAKMKKKENLLTVYLWNANRNDFLIREMSISTRQGNPDRYAL